MRRKIAIQFTACAAWTFALVPLFGFPLLACWVTALGFVLISTALDLDRLFADAVPGDVFACLHIDNYRYLNRACLYYGLFIIALPIAVELRNVGDLVLIPVAGAVALFAIVLLRYAAWRIPRIVRGARKSTLFFG